MQKYNIHMIEYDDEEETFVITCDKCGDEETFTGTWNDCIRQARVHGWVIKKAIISFEHYCGWCKSWD